MKELQHQHEEITMITTQRKHAKEYKQIEYMQALS